MQQPMFYGQPVFNGQPMVKGHPAFNGQNNNYTKDKDYDYRSNYYQLTSQEAKQNIRNNYSNNQTNEQNTSNQNTRTQSGNQNNRGQSNNRNQGNQSNRNTGNKTANQTGNKTANQTGNKTANQTGNKTANQTGNKTVNRNKGTHNGQNTRYQVQDNNQNTSKYPNNQNIRNQNHTNNRTTERPKTLNTFEPLRPQLPVYADLTLKREGPVKDTTGKYVNTDSCKKNSFTVIENSGNDRKYMSSCMWICIGSIINLLSEGNKMARASCIRDNYGFPRESVPFVINYDDSELSDEKEHNSYLQQACNDYKFAVDIYIANNSGDNGSLWIGNAAVRFTPINGKPIPPENHFSIVSYGGHYELIVSETPTTMSRLTLPTYGVYDKKDLRHYTYIPEEEQCVTDQPYLSFADQSHFSDSNDRYMSENRYTSNQSKQTYVTQSSPKQDTDMFTSSIDYSDMRILDQLHSHMTSLENENDAVLRKIDLLNSERNIWGKKSFVSHLNEQIDDIIIKKNAKTLAFYEERSSVLLEALDEMRQLLEAVNLTNDENQ